MHSAYPIGFSLSKPMFERLDEIARAESVSRSSVVRTLLLAGLVAYERETGAPRSLDEHSARISRRRRPRLRQESEAALSPFVERKD